MKKDSSSATEEHAPMPDIDLPDSMLHRLASISTTSDQNNQSNGPSHKMSDDGPVMLPETLRSEKQVPKKNLIQELPTEGAKLCKPKYSLERSQSEEHLVLRVELPGVKSVSDCQLDISEVSVFQNILFFSVREQNEKPARHFRVEHVQGYYGLFFSVHEQNEVSAWHFRGEYDIICFPFQYRMKCQLTISEVSISQNTLFFSVHEQNEVPAWHFRGEHVLEYTFFSVHEQNEVPAPHLRGEHVQEYYLIFLSKSEDNLYLIFSSEFGS